MHTLFILLMRAHIYDLQYRDRSGQNAMLDRDNVAVVALLEERQAPYRQIIIANTHLLFNTKRGEIKIAQLRLLHKHIDEMIEGSVVLSRASDASRTDKENGEEIAKPAVIICGDFNSTPDSEVYQLMKRGCINLGNVDRRSASGQWKLETRQENNLPGRGKKRCICYFRTQNFTCTLLFYPSFVP